MNKQVDSSPCQTYHLFHRKDTAVKDLISPSHVFYCLGRTTPAEEVRLARDRQRQSVSWWGKKGFHDSNEDSEEDTDKELHDEVNRGRVRFRLS